MAFYAECDIDGAEVWTRQFGTSESDEILSMAIDASGLYPGGRDHRHRWPGRPAQGPLDAFVRNVRFQWRGGLDQGSSARRSMTTRSASRSARVASYVAGNTTGALPGHT